MREIVTYFSTHNLQIYLVVFLANNLLPLCLKNKVCFHNISFYSMSFITVSASIKFCCLGFLYTTSDFLKPTESRQVFKSSYVFYFNFLNFFHLFLLLFLTLIWVYCCWYLLYTSTTYQYCLVYHGLNRYLGVE